MLSIFVFATCWILIATRSINTDRNQECYAMPRLSRVECGRPQITEEECEALGCCFDSSEFSLWCFYKDRENDKEGNSHQIPLIAIDPARPIIEIPQEEGISTGKEPPIEPADIE